MRVAAALLLLSAVAGCGKHALAPKPPTSNGGAGGAAGAGAGAAGSGTAGSAMAGAAGEPVPAEDAGMGGGDASADVADAHTAPPPEDAGAVDLYPTDAGALPTEPYRALTVAAGRLHTCALLDDHRVKCWGENVYGQLGVGDGTNRTLPADMGDHLPTVDLGTGRTAKAITAGRYATCAILDDDSVKCWGWAQLAHGATNQVLGGDGMIGNGPGEMGDALAPMDLGPGRTARLIALGYYDGCVVKDDESIHCWSSNVPSVELQPFPGRRVVRLFSGGGVLALLDDGTVSQLFASLNPGLTVPPAPDPTKGADVRAIAVAGSRQESCVVWANGDSRCSDDADWWPAPNVSKVRAAGVLELTAFACGIVDDGHVYCPRGAMQPWNNGDVGPNGPFVRLGQPAVAITGGSEAHFCAALLDGEVKCWGSSTDGMHHVGLGGTIVTETSWPSVDLGARPAR
jgi:hypothetical protein